MSVDLARRLYGCGFTGFGGVPDGPVLRINGLAAKSASETPVMPTNRAAKTRRLKKADREVDFFFISGYKWMEFECETPLLAEMPETRQHFFLFFPYFLFFTQ
jgi:hypothetical protein